MTGTPTEFDQYAAEYDRALAQGLELSGEDKDYFAEGRAARLAKCLQTEAVHPREVLDFGCGTGQSTPHLLSHLAAERVVGVDISDGQLAVARRDHGSARATFHRLDEYRPAGQIDVAFCSGVFHHIPPDERAAMVDYVFRSLRPGGLFALWENNPWNPGTRMVMRRIPFDRNAIMLAAPAARRLLRAGHFEVVSVRFAFVFPRALRWLRWLEPLLAWLPAGAQYQVLARKPRSGQRGNL